MMQHECFLAYAPRGAGLLCAVTYVSGEPDIVGWFVQPWLKGYKANPFAEEYWSSAAPSSDSGYLGPMRTEGGGAEQRVSRDLLRQKPD